MPFAAARGMADVAGAEGVFVPKSREMNDTGRLSPYLKISAVAKPLPPPTIRMEPS